MNYLENQSFNIGLLISFICGGVFVVNSLILSYTWLTMLNGALGLIGFIFLMRGITEVNKIINKHNKEVLSKRDSEK